VADPVVRVVRDETWEGHVYNLSTETGAYAANGLIVHNCRCIVALSAQKAMVAAADMAHDGALIVMLPEEISGIHEISSEDDAHITTVWFGSGDESVADIDAISAALERIAPTLQPVEAGVKERGTLGDDEADVLFLDSEPLIPLRDMLIEEQVIADAMNAVEQFPNWTPHVTLGYPEEPAADGEVPTVVRFDRLALWVGDDHSNIYPMGAEMADDGTTEVVQDDEEQAPPPLPPDARLETDAAVPFWGVLAPENVESGDRRLFATDSLRSRPLPLPLAFQRVNEEGHDSSVKVGNIERTWRKNGMAYASGHFSTVVPEVDELLGLMVEAGGRIGVSVDADDSGVISMQTRDGRSMEDVMAEAEEGMEDEGDMLDMLFNGPDEDMITVFESARISGATCCHIPAFHQAFVEVGDVPEEFAPQDGEDLVVESIAEQEVSEEAEPLSAAAFVKTEDGPGWLTHPVDTDRLRDYWVRGPGAAKINWGVPGDFNRCRTLLAEYVKPQHLSGYCANRHYDALGFWPGRPVSGDTITASAPEGEAMRPAITFITASGGKVKPPPAEWFLDPELDGPTPVTITEDGRVFGHVATWGTCHIGFADKCVTPPSSPTAYAYFRTGATPVEGGGTVPTGALTVGTGHADIKAKAKAALAHYDNTGTNAANVSAGEDKYGIWIAGAVNPYASEEQVYALRTAALSGDWREIGGSLEMIAALAVNVPGFPIPRVALAASAGEQTSLVAAGIVPPRHIGMTVDQIKSVVIETIESREAQQQMAALRRKYTTARMERLRARRAEMKG